jgi:hypothetical protein
VRTTFRISETASGDPTVTNSGTFQPRTCPCWRSRLYATTVSSECATTTVSRLAVNAALTPTSIVSRMTAFLR